MFSMELEYCYHLQIQKSESRKRELFLPQAWNSSFFFKKIIVMSVSANDVCGDINTYWTKGKLNSTGREWFLQKVEEFAWEELEQLRTSATLITDPTIDSMISFLLKRLPFTDLQDVADTYYSLLKFPYLQNKKSDFDIAAKHYAKNIWLRKMKDSTNMNTRATFLTELAKNISTINNGPNATSKHPTTCQEKALIVKLLLDNDCPSKQFKIVNLRKSSTGVVETSGVLDKDSLKFYDASKSIAGLSNSHFILNKKLHHFLLENQTTCRICAIQSIDGLTKTVKFLSEEIFTIEEVEDEEFVLEICKSC